MVTTKYDTTSKLHLNFPDRDRPADTVNSSRALIKYEQSLPSEEQLRHTPYMAALVTDWDAADAKRLDGEVQRAEAAEAIERLDREMIEVVRTIRKIIDAAFPTNPSRAKAWGFEAKKSTKNILLPQTRKEHLNLLDKYIAKEQSRPEEERFTSPNLADVIRVRDDLRQQLDIRAAGQNQREEAVVTCNQIAADLYNFLQSAATDLLTFKFKFKLTVELQKWGYDVSPRRTASAEEEAEAVADASAETGTASEPAPAASTSEAPPTNGAYTNGSPSEDGNLIPDMLANDWE
ncbi:MAG TPA: hypothetical protein P5526_05630 [Anaerolineae bacterium]|nr:hypothetical protein [Anaerolineae bacterium]